ncbi:MAG TPA: hypothetical protein VFW63_13710, partial [Acidimicrobiales bacterium]|nr:hypothetical protein [Acidimicrobiales bacterium]
DVTVAVGAHVERGDRLGTAGERLHLGARAGDAYLDPAALFGDGAAVELVPFEVAPGSTPDAERRALVDLTLGRGPHLVDLRAAASWLADRLAVRPPGPAGLAMAADLVEGLAAPGPCSSGPPPAHPAAGARRVAVTVAGLGSSSGPATIDDLPFRDLGYHRGAVVRFSYAGGRTPGTGEDVVPEVAPRAYTSADTQGDVHRAASRLATLVEATAAADPEATVDLYAHSLGGLVVRLALDRLQRGGFPLSRLGIVVTLSSPHRGADLATVLARLAGRPVAGTVLDGASTRLGLDLDPDAAVLAQLAERSGVVTDLAEAGVPEGVRLLSLGARGDPIVPAPRTQVDGAVNVTLPVSGPGAHTAVVTSPAAAAEVARALADQPPGCQPWHDVLADVLVGQAVTGLESHLGAVVGASG